MCQVTRSNGKSQVQVTFDEQAPAGMAQLVTINEDHYWVERFETDYGLGVRFAKLGGEEPYHVLLENDRADCSCRGFLRYERCRHVIATRLLVEAGLLRKSPRPEQAVEMPARVEPAGHYCTLCKNFLAVEGEDLCYDCLYPF